ncbi:hypothetical protein BC835DRAFT_1305757 [Cytidiella melzeri]|nr:hypothetical protein BC835DRAFT_1305757 [Cytidiella melzeri]
MLCVQLCKLRCSGFLWTTCIQRHSFRHLMLSRVRSAHIAGFFMASTQMYPSKYPTLPWHVNSSSLLSTSAGISYSAGPGVSEVSLPSMQPHGGRPHPYMQSPASHPPHFLPMSPPASTALSPVFPGSPSSSLFATNSQSFPSPITPYEDFATQQDRQADMSSNQRRNESMQRHRSRLGGRLSPPSSGLETSRRPGPAHAYPSSSRSAPIAHPTMQGTIVILPYTLVQGERNPEDIPPAFSWPQTEMPTVLQRHADVGLTVKVDFTLETNIFMDIHHAFTDHLTRNGFQFPTGSSSASDVIPPTLTIDNAPWLMLKPKYKSTHTRWELALPTINQLIPQARVTVETLTKSWTCKVYDKDWVLFIVPLPVETPTGRYVLGSMCAKPALHDYTVGGLFVPLGGRRGAALIVVDSEGGSRDVAGDNPSCKIWGITDVILPRSALKGRATPHGIPD